MPIALKKQDLELSFIAFADTHLSNIKSDFSKNLAMEKTNMQKCYGFKDAIDMPIDLKDYPCNVCQKKDLCKNLTIQKIIDIQRKVYLESLGYYSS